MSRHVGRKQRWTQADAKTYGSALGKVVYEQDAWYALLNYRMLAPPEPPGGPSLWLAEARRLGPYKRPRNAMVALEREATMLKNRHGQSILFGPEGEPRL